MRVVVQRSGYSSVSVDNKLINEIAKGLVLLVSFTHTDTKENVLKMVFVKQKLQCRFFVF